MRIRTVREGSVGLLILLGLGLFVGLVLWLRGVTFGQRSYKIFVEFADAAGLQKGAVVRYRGVQAGKISEVRPQPNGVEVEIDINPADLVIPRDVIVEANQSGLVGETTVDITPQGTVSPGAIAADVKPTPVKKCDPNLIVCDGSRLHGQIGVSIDALIRSTNDLTRLYSDPKLFANLTAVTKNASVAAEGVTQLTRDLRRLSRSAETQLGSVSGTASSVQRAANQISSSTDRTAAQLSATASEFSATAVQANRLVTNLDNLVTSNRSALVATLNNVSQTSDQLRTAVSSLTPTLNRFSKGKLIDNLETLSANAAQASANLRDATSTLNNPNNLLLLQQTLDSARTTFQNAQKITSDLDELTGDPTFRQNVRQLVNGLSGLVSSTQQLQQQTNIAAQLGSIKTTFNKSDFSPLSLSSIQEGTPVNPNLDNAIFPSPSNVSSSGDLVKARGTQGKGEGGKAKGQMP